MSKKYFERKMNEVRSNIAGITALTSQPTVSFDAYRAARMNLNIRVLEIIFGATIENGKISFNHDLPTMTQMNELQQVFAGFYDNVEDPIMEKFWDAAADDVNGNTPVGMTSECIIPMFNKIKVKDVKSAIVGGDNCAFPMYQMFFNPIQLMEMAALSEDLRKVVRRNQILIIGGITLAVIAVATTAGILIYQHNKAKEEAEECDAPEVDDVFLDEEDETPIVDLAAV